MRGFGRWVLSGVWLTTVLLGVFIFSAAAQDAGTSASPGSAAEGSGASAPAPMPSTFDEVIDRVVEREHQLLAQMRNLRPMVETYVQNLKSDASGKVSPIGDQYLLGRLDMSDGPQNISFTGQPGFSKGKLMGKLVG